MLARQNRNPVALRGLPQEYVNGAVYVALLCASAEHLAWRLQLAEDGSVVGLKLDGPKQIVAPGVQARFASRDHAMRFAKMLNRMAGKKGFGLYVAPRHDMLVFAPGVRQNPGVIDATELFEGRQRAVADAKRIDERMLLVMENDDLDGDMAVLRALLAVVVSVKRIAAPQRDEFWGRMALKLRTEDPDWQQIVEDFLAYAEMQSTSPWRDIAAVCAQMAYSRLKEGG